MQSSVIFVTLLFATAYAGTRRAEPGEESRAVALWEKHCTNGRDGGVENGIFIHCKHPLGQETKSLGAVVNAAVGRTAQREQYIFVQPAPIHFRHDLAIQGGAALEPKTIVYVKPAKTSHTYNAQVDVRESDHVKPELVFLGSENTGSVGSFEPRTTSRPAAIPSNRFRGHGSDDDHIVI